MTKRLPKKGKLVWVQWIDSESSTGWGSPGSHSVTRKTLLCESVGWLLCADRVYFSVAGSISNPHRHCNSVMNIPTEAVQAWKHLR